jgi:RNA polymerase sigma factor (sigma-70 family)
MTDGHDDFAQVFERARAGDQEAISQLVSDFESELRIIARNRLGPALRPYLDSMDLVVSVQKSLLKGIRQDRFDVSSRERLMGLVVVMLRRKVARYWRRHRQQVRNEQTESVGGELVDIILSLSDTQEDPVQQVSHREQIDGVLRRLDPVERELIKLRLEGNSTADAARALNVDADVLRVRLSRLRRRLSEISVFADLL